MDMKKDRIRVNKGDIKNVLLLFAVLTICLLIITRFRYYFGSKVDWINQHWAIPEYFRTLFYDTHQLFPNFAFNIGGGQNIYYLSYYGLFSPIILISYLFPFVPMMTYIMTVSIAALYIDCIIFYKWMRSKFDMFTSFFMSFLFLFSMPLIYHSHKHIMFVIYMPFLVLAFMAVDGYCKSKRKAPLIISCFLIMMTSFYFAVGAFIAVMLYAVYVKLGEKTNAKEMILHILKMGLCLVISAMLSGILIIPTFYTLLSGRNPTSELISLTEFIPKLDFNNILYNPYSSGLTAFSFSALILGIFSKKKDVRFLSAGLCIVSFLSLSIYLMNGTMYIDAKVLIPFMPLIVLITAELYLNITEKNLDYKKSTVIIGVAMVLAIISAIFDKSLNWSRQTQLIFCTIFVSETIMIYICVSFFRKYGKKRMIFIPIMVIELVICICCNLKDTLVRIDNHKYVKETDSVSQIIDDTLNEDNSFYRIGNYIDIHNTVNLIDNPEYYQSTIYSSTHNKCFSNFYFNSIYNETRFRNAALTIQPNNYLFNVFMGNKYIIDKSTISHSGYTKVRDYGEMSLYKSDYVLPVGYVSDKFMSDKEFSRIGYPYNIEAQLEYTIVDNAPDSGFISKIKKMNLPSKPKAAIDLSHAQNSQKIDVSLDKPYNYSVNFDKPIVDKMIFLRFNADNRLMENKKDIWVEINRTRNKLTKSDWKYQNNNYTFDYIFAANEPLDKLNITFSKGNYSISDVEMYTMPIEDVNLLNQDTDAYIIDREKTSGDTIYGTVDTLKGGCMVLSIPYDKGFSVIVDGKECEYKRVNWDFIGFDIVSGKHTVLIKYKAPFRDIGKYVSICGLILLLSVTACDTYKSIKNKNK